MEGAARARWRRAKELFDRAIVLDGAERDRVLEHHCGGDTALRDEVRGLLAAERDAPGSFLEYSRRHFTVPEDEDLSGTRVQHFLLERRIDGGGQGEIYVGVNEALRKKVALKVLRAELRLKPDARARFLREARILSQLDHEHICHIDDYLTGDGIDYLVLEFIDGRGLDHLIHEGCLEPEAKLRIARQIAGVLVEAHGAGVVHRDLKPGNVMINSDGKVKVLDFGLARHAERAPAGEFDSAERRLPATTRATSSAETAAPDRDDERRIPIRTRAGRVMGTVTYMCPEQALGETVTMAGDVYSFGLLLQRMFTGKSPYGEGLDSDEILERARRARTLPAEGLDKDLARLIQRMKSLAPARRPTAEEVAERLRWIAEKPARRLRRAAIAAAVLSVLFVGVKYTLDVRHERGVARERKAEAENLLNFMLGDLRDRLEQIGKVPILSAVGDKALDYYAKFDEAELSTSERRLYATALTQIGQVRLAEGRPDEAMALFRDTVSRRRHLAEADPLNGELQKELGEAHFYVALVHYDRNEIEDALREIREYRRIVQQLVSREPESDEWQRELAYCHTNLGQLLEYRGDTAGAIAEYRAALGIKTLLVNRNSDDVETVHSLTVSEEDLGGLLQSLGLVDEAVEHFRTALSWKLSLARLEPDNVLRKRALGTCLSLLGDALETNGDGAGALEQYLADLEITRGLSEADPDDLALRREFAISLGRVGFALRDSSPASGLRYLEKAKRTMVEALETDSSNAGWRRDAAAIDFKLAWFHEMRGDMQEALLHASRGRAALESLLEEYPEDREAALRLSLTLLLQGRADAALGNADRAAENWSRAVVVIEPVARDTEEVAPRKALARGLLRLDRLEEAAALAGALPASSRVDWSYFDLCVEKGVCTE